MRTAAALLACLAASCAAAAAPAAALDSSVPHVGAGAAAAAGYDGSGVTVAVIDTGIDASHPDLAGRVAGAHDLLGGGDPSDSDGHGTGVAGVIAASGALRGVAPGASVISYKVSEDGESAPSALIAEAIRRAEADGADIINISLGVNRTDPAIDRAVAGAVGRGTVVVAAAGNDGPGPGSIGSPGRGRGAITVGATYNDVAASTVATLEAGGRRFQAAPMAGSPADAGAVEGPVAFGGYARDRDLAGGGFAGAIVLAERGSDVEGEVVYFSDKERAAADAGAAAIVVYNSGEGMYLGELVHEHNDAGYEPRIPAVSVSREDGLAIRGMLHREVGAELRVFSGPDFVAHFSSRGPVSPFYHKPDLVAPGALVNTTAPGGGYAVSSGTSFAAPHVSGAAALLLQRHPGLSPADVAALLATTADPAGGPGGEGRFGRHDAGAGRLNASRAFGAGLVASPPSLAIDLSPWAPEASAELSLRPLGGAAGGAEVSVEAPDGIEAWREGGGIRARAAGAGPGEHEGRVRVLHGGTEYSVPALFRVSEGAVSARAAPGGISFEVAGPEGWTYAKVTATHKGTGERYSGSALPGGPGLVRAGGGEYWLEARIEAGGRTAGAFGEAEAGPALPGWPPAVPGAPERQLLMAAAAAAAIGAAGAAFRTSAARRRAPRARPG